MSADSSAKIPYPSTLFVREDDARYTKARIDQLNARAEAAQQVNQEQGVAAAGKTTTDYCGPVDHTFPSGPSFDDYTAARALKAGLRGSLAELQQQRSKLTYLINEQNSKIRRIEQLLRDLGELS